MLEAAAAPLCADHPDRPSAGTCARCGRFACAECFCPASGRCVTCEAKSDPLGVRGRPFSAEASLRGAFALLRASPEMAAVVTLVMALSTTLEILLGPEATRPRGADAPVPWDWGNLAIRLGLAALRTVVLYSFLRGALYASMTAAAQGERMTFGQALREAARAWSRLAWAAVQVLVLISLGLVFCVVPGLMAMTNLFVTSPAAFLDRDAPPLEASSEATRGRRGTVFALVALEVAVFYGLAAVRNVARQWLGFVGGEHPQLTEVAGTYCTQLLLEAAQPWSLALSLAAYYGLKASPPPPPTTPPPG